MDLGKCAVMYTSSPSAPSTALINITRPEIIRKQAAKAVRDEPLEPSKLMKYPPFPCAEYMWKDYKKEFGTLVVQAITHQ
jgi:hypothetical protein